MKFERSKAVARQTQRMLACVLVMLIFSCQINAQKIRVAIASSLTGVMQDLWEDFLSKKALDIEFIPAASGTLAHQALNGAPFDVFISADHKYCTLLHQSLPTPEPLYNIFYGQIAIWSKNLIDTTGLSFSKALRNSFVKNPKQILAMPNAQIAPYGKVATAWIEQHGILQNVNRQLIVGNNVSLTNQYIHSGSADVVITAHSSVYYFQKSKGFWYYPIVQSPTQELGHCIIILSENVKNQTFLNHLFSPRTAKILSSRGFQMGELRLSQK